jgi:hypothetical protein
LFDPKEVMYNTIKDLFGLLRQISLIGLAPGRHSLFDFNDRKKVFLSIQNKTKKQANFFQGHKLIHIHIILFFITSSFTAKENTVLQKN